MSLVLVDTIVAPYGDAQSTSLNFNLEMKGHFKVVCKMF